MKLDDYWDFFNVIKIYKMTVITHSLNINLETGRVLLIVFVLIYLTEQSSDWVILLCASYRWGNSVICTDHTALEWQRWDSPPKLSVSKPSLLLDWLYRTKEPKPSSEATKHSDSDGVVGRNSHDMVRGRSLLWNAQ